MWVALGSPCVSAYVPFRPADGVPAGLADASRWARLAAVRDLVEARPERLAEVRAAIDPIEAAARDDALDAVGTLAALDAALALLVP